MFYCSGGLFFFFLNLESLNLSSKDLKLAWMLEGAASGLYGEVWLLFESRFLWKKTFFPQGIFFHESKPILAQGPPSLLHWASREGESKEGWSGVLGSAFESLLSICDPGQVSANLWFLSTWSMPGPRAFSVLSGPQHPHWTKRVNISAMQGYYDKRNEIIKVEGPLTVPTSEWKVNKY